MRARITVDVPDSYLEERVAAYAKQDGEAPFTAREFFKQRLEDVCDDELRIALWQWPLETTVEVVT